MDIHHPFLSEFPQHRETVRHLRLSDIQQIQMVLVMMLRMVLLAPITGVWAIIKAYNQAPSLSWVIALAVGTLITIIITWWIYKVVMGFAYTPLSYLLIRILRGKNPQSQTSAITN